jgi:hypothetical protein
VATLLSAIMVEMEWEALEVVLMGRALMDVSTVAKIAAVTASEAESLN